MSTKLKYIVVLGFLLMAQSTFAGLVDCNIPLKEPLTSEVLDEATKQCGIDTTTKLRYILPKSFRSNFTFLRHSASAFSTCIDPQRFSPRLLMFSPKSNLIIGMAWNPEMVGNFNCNGFETLELKHGATKITLTLHRLPPIPPKDQPLPRKIEPVMKCIFCHGESGTPIWPQYETWKSDGGTEAYGFNDDNLIRGSEEAKEYANFLNHIKNDGTINSLLWPKGDARDLSEAKSRMNNDYASDSVDEKFVLLPPYQFVKTPVKGHDANYRGNLKFTQAVARINTAKIYNQFIQHPLYNDLKLILAYMEGDCYETGVSANISNRLDDKKLKILDSGLVAKVEENGVPQYEIKALGNIDILAFTKFIGLKEEDITIDPKGLSVFTQAFPDGYFDGENRTIGLLAIMALAHDKELRPSLVGEYQFYGNERYHEDAYAIPSSNQKFCQKLRNAMDN